MKQYTTYKYYDDRGRRLSIFAFPELGKMYVFTCSKKDIFKKSDAQAFMRIMLSGNEKVIKANGLKPQIINLFEGFDQNDFISVCNNAFHKIYEDQVVIIGHTLISAKAEAGRASWNTVLKYKSLI